MEMLLHIILIQVSTFFKVFDIEETCHLSGAVQKDLYLCSKISYCLTNKPPFLKTVIF